MRDFSKLKRYFLIDNRIICSHRLAFNRFLSPFQVHLSKSPCSMLYDSTHLQCYIIWVSEQLKIFNSPKLNWVAPSRTAIACISNMCWIAYNSSLHRGVHPEFASSPAISDKQGQVIRSEAITHFSDQDYLVWPR